MFCRRETETYSSGREKLPVEAERAGFHRDHQAMMGCNKEMTGGTGWSRWQNSHKDLPEAMHTTSHLRSGNQATAPDAGAAAQAVKQPSVDRGIYSTVTYTNFRQCPGTFSECCILGSPMLLMGTSL